MSAAIYMADMVDAFLPALQEEDRVTILLGSATLLPWEQIEHPSVTYLIAQEIPNTFAAHDEMAALVQQIRPDVWWTADTTLPPPKSKHFSPKIVYAVEDFRTLLGSDRRSFWARTMAMRRSRKNLHNADAIICPVKAMAARIVHTVGIAARHKTFVIPNGIHPIFRHHTDEEVLNVRRKLLIPQRYVLTACTADVANYLTPILEAMGASEDVPSSTCVVLGDADLPDAVREVIRDCHLEGMVRFLNISKLAPAEIAALYSGASVFFEPSQDIAYLPSILRAMASGTPVICAASAANEALYNQAVLRVHPTDAQEWIRAFTALTLSTVLRDRQIANGLSCAAKFTSTAMAKQSFAFARLLCTVPASTIRKNHILHKND